MKLPDLTGHLAVVTGSSSGIGRSIAITLAQAGAKVAISYHSNAEGGEEVRNVISKMGAHVHCGPLDTSDESSIEEYMDSVRTALGDPTIFINNAGIDGEKTDLDEMPTELWDKIIDTNLKGSFLCIRNVLPNMKAKQRGVILNITSVHDVIPWAGQAPYCAAKAGIAMMTRSLALELQNSGVRVLCLAPGAIRTPINRDVWDDPENLADLHTKIPLQRIGEPEEIARMAAVLVSDLASYMTGVTVTVDGGMTAYPSFADGG